jgi:hypothetical protein
VTVQPVALPADDPLMPPPRGAGFDLCPPWIRPRDWQHVTPRQREVAYQRWRASTRLLTVAPEPAGERQEIPTPRAPFSASEMCAAKAAYDRWLQA